ncbi:MAG: Hsp70 family protein [Acidobacteriota bacterium]
MRCVGLDFGTTNTAAALAEPGSEPRLVRFPTAEGPSAETFRSLLHVYRDDDSVVHVPAGPEALSTYLAADPAGRLIQSLKSFLANASFETTVVEGRPYSLEDLIAAILRGVRSALPKDWLDDTRLVVGRPVTFVDAHDQDDDERAARRLRRAFELAGFGELELLHEPVAAAWEYQQRLTAPEITLIADFGGGTTDLCLMELEPGASGGRVEVLGTAGLPIAGDVIDGRMVHELVAPALGEGTTFRSELGKELPVPRWIYGHLERWHLVPFLGSPENLRLLSEIERGSDDQEKIHALRQLVVENLGFDVHGAVQACKLALSQERHAEFRCELPGLEIRRHVDREELEEWITEELAAFAGATDEFLVAQGLTHEQVGSVFLTGGSSLIPAVRRLYLDRFGDDRVRSGHELTSVASGLARRGLAA